MPDEMLKPTTSRLILVRELAEGPKTHKALRVAFFGEARAAGNSANTSFRNKLVDGISERLIKKDSVGIYALDVEGHILLAYAREKGLDLASLKSEAQVRWELDHPTK
jgi:hypothetical protein